MTWRTDVRSHSLDSVARVFSHLFKLHADSLRMAQAGFEETGALDLAAQSANRFEDGDPKYEVKTFERSDGATVECMFKDEYLHLVTVIEEDGFFIEIPPDSISLSFVEAGLGFRPKVS
ncbi:MAG: hypothetical protein AAF441_16695 [Pseudomonadota bacterium]